MVEQMGYLRTIDAWERGRVRVADRSVIVLST